MMYRHGNKRVQVVALVFARRLRLYNLLWIECWQASKWQTCLVYLDDVVVFASSFDDRLRRLGTVKMVKTPGPDLRPQKCRFAYEQLLFLTHVIKKSGWHPDLQ